MAAAERGQPSGEAQLVGKVGSCGGNARWRAPPCLHKAGWPASPARPLGAHLVAVGVCQDDHLHFKQACQTTMSRLYRLPMTGIYSHVSGHTLYGR